MVLNLIFAELVETGIDFDFFFPSCQIINVKLSAIMPKSNARSFAIRKSFVIPLKLLQNVPYLSRIFTSCLLEPTECYVSCETRTKMLISYLQQFGLFGCKWVSNHTAIRFWSESNLDLSFDLSLWFPSLKAGVIFAFRNWFGNFPSLMQWLKFFMIKLAKISEWSLNILKEIPSDCADFEVSKIQFVSDNSKKTTLLIIFLFILRMLGWAIYFVIVFKTGSIRN